MQNNAKPKTIRISLIPRILGKTLIMSGNLLYGRKPSYLKFRCIEVIARVPYQSWTSALFTLHTLCYTNTDKVLALSQEATYATFAQHNETMHVVVITELSKQECNPQFVRHTLLPMLFACVYFWVSYILYLFSPRMSYELNYLFEDHAYAEYDTFLQMYEKTLRAKPMSSRFLSWYGRAPENQYAFFQSVRDDERTHRDHSLEKLLNVRA